MLIGFAAVGCAVLVTSALAGSAAQGLATPAPGAGLPEVVWHLERATLADGSSVTPDDPARYTVQFRRDGTVAIQADCNSGSGNYNLDGANLSIDQIATTLVGCPPESLGDRYLEWLAGVVSYAFDGEALVLTLGDGAGSLRFRPALTGVVWEWQALQSSNDTTTVPSNPATYTLEFLPDGRVAVHADCNRGRGRYQANPPQLTITQIATTKVRCPPGSLGDRYLADLQAVTSYVFSQGQLSLALPVDAGFLLFTARAGGNEPATPAAG
jgi:heat shock protein HslJ